MIGEPIPAGEEPKVTERSVARLVTSKPEVTVDLTDPIYGFSFFVFPDAPGRPYEGPLYWLGGDGELQGFRTNGPVGISIQEPIEEVAS